MERLQKVIAQSGYTSRRKAEQLIVDGKVTVNGEVVRELGTKVSKKDLILVNGVAMKKEEKEYYLFNKPKQTITSMSDDKDRDTVADYFKGIDKRVYPVGRLDWDTTGALIMTNDGEFANLLMHPSSHLPKVYYASLDGVLTQHEKRSLERGIYLEGVKTLPCEIAIRSVDEEHKTTMIAIRLVEGKNRQIKKMFESVGHNVKRLHRVMIGDLEITGIKPGEFRKLKTKEVRVLRAQAIDNKIKNADKMPIVRKDLEEDMAERDIRVQRGHRKPNGKKDSRRTSRNSRTNDNRRNSRDSQSRDNRRNSRDSQSRDNRRNSRDSQSRDNRRNSRDAQTRDSRRDSRGSQSRDNRRVARNNNSNGNRRPAKRR